ncbi:MAG TPA: hypothetical protein VJB99_04395 [Patescibacteria group bacterium]|nr:hypothetical protein [Patescibacteria group bacterium]
MSDLPFSFFVAATQRAVAVKAKQPEGELLHVSETVSAAAAAYEMLRNSIEYGEEHLLRRNAVRRILKRRWGEEEYEKLARDLINELIWARYLPNDAVPSALIGDVAAILGKYRPLFATLEVRPPDSHKWFEWLLDLLSTEIEFQLVPPFAEESLARFVYQDIKDRLKWESQEVQSEDRDLQLYLAVHRALIKSNPATLRYRAFVLFYPAWTKQEDETLTRTVAEHLGEILEAIERQIRYPSADRLFRMVQRHAIVYHVLFDIVQKNPFGTETLGTDPVALQKAVGEAAAARYDRFHARIRRSILRAIVFLFFTKTVLAFLVEWPYEAFVVQSTDYLPLLTNIVFHPLLLGIIGLTVTIPEGRNTAAVLSDVKGVLGLEERHAMRFVPKKAWMKGRARAVFDGLYAFMFLVTLSLISTFLHSLGFNAVSIVFFLFFLSLVTFFGIRIRGSRRELVLSEGIGGNVWSLLFDLFLLPVVRAGRWISLRAPRVNIFLFFFDFIIEAPFKAGIQLLEGWFAFLREKREDI